MIKFGNNDTKLYLGANEVTSIYLGSTQVYDGGDTPTPPTPPTPSYDTQYLTFNILSSGTIVWKNEGYSGNKTISYSFDDGSTWTDITATRAGTSFNVNADDKVIFKGNNEKYCNDNISYYHHFGGTAMFSVEGNIMSLISGDSFTSATTLSSYAFANLFRDITGLTDVSNLVLPATTLANYCYMSMFQNCASITTAPELPATTLANSCYQWMFLLCSSLNYIKCLATNISATQCTSSWVQGVAASGTFVKAASMSSWTTGDNGIPNGWTVQNDDGSPVDNGGVDDWGDQD